MRAGDINRISTGSTKGKGKREERILRKIRGNKLVPSLWSKTPIKTKATSDFSWHYGSCSPERLELHLNCLSDIVASH